VQKRVIDEVVQLATLDHDLRVYGLPEPLTPGAAILPAAAPAGAPPIGTSEPTWLFFIDDRPRAYYGHAVRYVTVGAQSGKLAVLELDSWPVRGGEPVYNTDAGDDSPHLVYTTGSTASIPPPPPPNVPPPPPPPRSRICCPDGAEPARIALVIQGSGAASHVIKNTAALAQKTLAGAGFATTLIANTTVKGVTDALKAFVKDMSGKMRCCDEVVVYLNGHGHRLVERMDARGKLTGEWVRVNEAGAVVSNSGSVTAGVVPVPPNAPSRWQYFISPDQFLPADKIFALLAQLKTCHLTLVVESCHSGAIVDETDKLLPNAERVLTSQNRAAPSPTDGGPKDQGPQTGAMFGALKLAKDHDLGDQLDAAHANADAGNKFVVKGMADPAKSGHMKGYADGRTVKDGKKTFHAFPQRHERSKETPCPCCGDGRVQAPEECDWGKCSPTACKGATERPKTCLCATSTPPADDCSGGGDGAVQTESVPGTPRPDTPAKVGYKITHNPDGSVKVVASLTGQFNSTLQSGMFLRFERGDGAKAYFGTIGTQVSAFALDKNGKKIATCPCSLQPLAGGGSEVTAASVPAADLKGVTGASVEVTDGNCFGSLATDLAAAGGCPWAPSNP
jgi:hypothetical protein